MELLALQRAVLGAIQQPLTGAQRLRRRGPRGVEAVALAERLIKPNGRLGAAARLEIYARSYWFRLLSCFGEDFPGLRAVLGERRFGKLAVAYLSEVPSTSFTLRDLGARLEPWLRAHPEHAAGALRLCLDVVRLEWADIEVYDAAERTPLSARQLARLGADPRLRLQPCLRLLELAHPVDGWLLRVRHGAERSGETAANGAPAETARPRRRSPPPPRPRRVSLAVHRQDDSVYFKRLEPEALVLLRALQRGARLSAALEEAVRSSGLSAPRISSRLGGWFANWTALGWFC